MSALDHAIQTREEFYERMFLWVYKHPDRAPCTNIYTLELGPTTVDIMHSYARTVHTYLLGQGITATYDEGWVPTMEVNAWEHSWYVHNYHLGVSLVEGDVWDTWISLSSTEWLGGPSGTFVRYQGIANLLPLLRVTSNGVRAYMQCGTCHYSDIQVEHCGMGRELLSDCNLYTIRT